MSNATDIKSYLLQHAPLDHFWVLATENVQPGLVHFLGPDGMSYVLMDDDDERVEKCIEFLQSMNSPAFADVNEMDSYIEELRSKARRFMPGSTAEH